MPVAETSSFFSQVIQEHLELKRKNSSLDEDKPLDSYEVADPFDNHPLFKTEQQARLEETMDGTEHAVVDVEPLRWPGEEQVEPANSNELEDSLWSRSRDFDWGD